MKRIIKLAPQVPAWCNAENNIYLSSNGKRSKELKEGCDMKAIEKAVKAGLLILEEHEDEVVKKAEVPKEEPVAIEVKVQPQPAPKNIVEKVKAKKAQEAKAKVEEVAEDKKEEVKNEEVEK